MERVDELRREDSREPRSVECGDWRVTRLGDGEIRLDGGAMWGVVPASVWRALTPPDADNTIRVAIRPFLATRGDAVALIEPGLGSRWSEKERARYRIELGETTASSLARLGLAPEDVTDVVATHCHWDHFAGALAERDGRIVPAFPNARVHAPAVEVRRALDASGDVRRASYRREDVEAFLGDPRLVEYEGEREILPGLRVHVLGGHSEGVSVVTIDDREGSGAIFWSDVVPTTHHVQPPYIMAFDVDVERSFRVRSRWLARAADERRIGLFYHDAEVAFARIERDGRRYAARPLA
jgi:glyoxylase-like metal-dependent hydrolase (beta-lactamase superfamily II)